MSARQAMYPIRTMARVLKVSASGYYAWRSRPASARAAAGADLTRHIRTIHAGSHATYGAPRVHGPSELCPTTLVIALTGTSITSTK
jgi:putative transposase